MKTLFFTLSLAYSSLLLAQSKNGEGFLERKIAKQSLSSWQKQIAAKKSKTITDYFLLLPKSILEAELELKDDSKEFRLQSGSGERGRTNVKAGYLEAVPDAVIKMALFKDRVNNKDIIAIVLGCGAPPIQYCDYGFLEYNSANNKWVINKEVFPWKEFNKRCEEMTAKKKLKRKSDPELEGYFWPNIILPELGTTINVVDAFDENTTVFKISWNGQKFEIKE